MNTEEVDLFVWSLSSYCRNQEKHLIKQTADCAGRKCWSLSPFFIFFPRGKCFWSSLPIVFAQSLPDSMLIYNQLVDAVVLRDRCRPHLSHEVGTSTEAFVFCWHSSQVAKPQRNEGFQKNPLFGTDYTILNHTLPVIQAAWEFWKSQTETLCTEVLLKDPFTISKLKPITLLRDNCNLGR